MTNTDVRPVPAISARSARPSRWLLATFCLANFMAALDLFVVNVALQGIGAHFGGPLSDVSWVLNGYAIVFGALLIPAGRAADRFGRKGVFMLGVTLFTAASAACAGSPTLWVLVAFRGLQAAGAAILVPSSLGLVLTTAPPDRVLRNVRIWAVSSAVAGSAGPVAGGLLAQVDWRLIFLINLPIGLVTLVAAARQVPVLPRAAAAGVPAPAAAALLIAAIGATSLAVVKGPDWGWTDARVLLSWAAALASGAAFAAVNRRSAAPVTMAALGFLVIAAGQVLIALSLSGAHGHDYAVAILPGWVISGLGGGLAVPTITGLATVDLPAGASATGSAVLQMARQLGSVLGTAVLVAVLGAGLATGRAGGFLPAWWACVACYAAAAGVAAWLRGR